MVLLRRSVNYLKEGEGGAEKVGPEGNQNKSVIMTRKCQRVQHLTSREICFQVPRIGIK
jgi:hypothetical protein